jgi:hypothetical protein
MTLGGGGVVVPRPPVGRGYRRPSRAVVGAGGRKVTHDAALSLGAACHRDVAHPSTVSPASASAVDVAESIIVSGDTVRAAHGAPGAVRRAAAGGAEPARRR